MQTDTALSSICYKRNFLTEVIARVDLVSPLPVLAEQIPKEISRIALDSFPIDEPKRALTQEVILSSDKEPATRKQEFTEWNFYGRNREKRLTVVQQSFFVTYKPYEKYENLRGDFLAISNGFFKHFEEAQPSRLGLRYINQLDVPGSNPLDWQEYVNQELLCLFAYTVNNASPSRVFHNFEVAFGDFNLRFQFGIHNPDYPAPIRRRFFVLDYDAYFQGLLEPRDIPDYLDQYHGVIQNMFERNITDRLREVMNESE